MANIRDRLTVAFMFMVSICALLALIMFVVAVAGLPTSAWAQTTNYYAPDGRYLGQSYTGPGGTTNYYDSTGQYDGQSSINRGGTTNYYGPSGDYQGSSQTYPWLR